jgi:hypothetical protein
LAVNSILLVDLPDHFSDLLFRSAVCAQLCDSSIYGTLDF